MGLVIFKSTVSMNKFLQNGSTRHWAMMLALGLGGGLIDLGSGLQKLSVVIALFLLAKPLPSFQLLTCLGPILTHFSCSIH